MQQPTQVKACLPCSMLGMAMPTNFTALMACNACAALLLTMTFLCAMQLACTMRRQTFMIMLRFGYVSLVCCRDEVEMVDAACIKGLNKCRWFY